MVQESSAPSQNKAISVKDKKPGEYINSLKIEFITKLAVTHGSLMMATIWCALSTDNPPAILAAPVIIFAIGFCLEFLAATVSSSEHGKEVLSDFEKVIDTQAGKGNPSIFRDIVLWFYETDTYKKVANITFQTKELIVLGSIALTTISYALVIIGCFFLILSALVKILSTTQFILVALVFTGCVFWLIKRLKG